MRSSSSGSLLSMASSYSSGMYSVLKYVRSALRFIRLPFYIEGSPRQTLQIVERFGVWLRFWWLLLLGQPVVLFVYHFDLVLVVGNLRRWTPLTLSIDTFLPSSKDALNVIATLSKSALIKPFSLRKVFPLVVVIESIILNVCWWFLP